MLLVLIFAKMGKKKIRVPLKESNIHLVCSAKITSVKDVVSALQGMIALVATMTREILATTLAV